MNQMFDVDVDVSNTRKPLTVIHGSIDEVSVIPCSSVPPIERQRGQTSRLRILIKTLND